MIEMQNGDNHFMVWVETQKDKRIVTHIQAEKPMQCTCGVMTSMMQAATSSDGRTHTTCAACRERN